MCDRHNKTYYKKYKEWCDEIFLSYHIGMKQEESVEFFLIIRKIILKETLNL